MKALKWAYTLVVGILGGIIGGILYIMFFVIHAAVTLLRDVFSYIAGRTS